MKTYLYDVDAPKRPARLRPNSELLDCAKAVGIPLSRTLEEALAEILGAKQEADWRAENREALERYNQRIAHSGTFGDEFRRF